MSKLSEMIKKLCPNGVEYKRLGEVLKSIRTGLNPRQNFKLNEPKATNYYVTVKEISSGSLVFSEKTDRITDEAVKIIQNRSNLECGDVLLSGIGTIGKVAIVEIPTDNFNCSESVYLLKPNSDFITTKYLGYVLETADVQNQWAKTSVGSTLKGIRKETLVNILIPLPPLEIQCEIVQILDNFANLTAELTAELAKRKKQYEHYRDMLLNFEGGGRYDKLPISVLCNISRGRVMSKQYLREHVGKFPVFSSQTANGGVFGYIDSYDYDGEYLTWTTDGANAGSVFYQNGKFSITNVCGLVKAKSNRINIKYAYYYLAKNAKQYVSSGMGNPKLMSNVMGNIKIPLPPIAEQKRIVAILDRFDALCNSLTEGLPAEIELRRKQYEYYRDKLLSFKEVG